MRRTNPASAGPAGRPAAAGSPHRNETTSMQKYVCPTCGYVYDPALGDPDAGIAPGTPFEALPDNWACPLCGVPKSEFVPQ